jgi:hypothetical protein
MRSLALAVGLVVAAGCVAGESAARRPVKRAAPVVTARAAPAQGPAEEPDEPAVAFDDAWQSFGFAKCTYLAPRDGIVGDDGNVDVVVHFHAGQMSAADMRASGLRGVFVACGYGIGTTGYAHAFDDPRRFGQMLRLLTKSIGKRTGRGDVHVGHLALASWSAGFAAVQRILSVDEWYRATDTVVLLDSLHARYAPPHDKHDEKRIDPKNLSSFVRFAADARAGKKTMIVTHSTIVPPGYASTSEATQALAQAVGTNVERPDDDRRRLPFPGPRTSRRTSSMDLVAVADDQGFHVRGFRGSGPHDHFDHLHLIGDALRSWVVPRWYTPRQ